MHPQSVLMTSFIIPQCHEAISAPKAWNDAFERLLDNRKLINARNSLESCIIEMQNRSKRQQQEDLDEYSGLMLSLRCLQFDIAVETAGYTHQYDLSAKWLAATPAERGPHVLVGLSQACGISPNLDKARLSCYKELRLSYHWDAVSAAHQDSQDIDGIALAYILVLRNKLIKLPKITVQKPSRTRDKERSPLDNFLQKGAHAAHNKEEAGIFTKEMKAAFKERTANKGRYCTGCGAVETAGSCQKKDWKNRHKATCGKELDLQSAYESATFIPENARTALPGIVGPPAKGFKRTVELLQQISHLEHYTQADYAVTRSVYQNNEDTGLMFYTSPLAKAHFRARRDKAMTTGDQASVAYICEYILWDIESRRASDFVVEKVIQQLSREYAFPGLAQAMVNLKAIRDQHPQKWPHLQYAP
ncbi:hypothetical protein HWV62_41390 [Athelia sp. TMB]|nr:hypothetical protein HWV62_41390 [Athelia sp. TMB]